MKVFAAALISVFLCSSVARANPRTFDVPAAHLYPSDLSAVRYHCDSAFGYSHGSDLFMIMGLLSVVAGGVYATTANEYTPPTVPIMFVVTGFVEIAFSKAWKKKAKSHKAECERLTGRGL